MVEARTPNRRSPWSPHSASCPAARPPTARSGSAASTPTCWNHSAAEKVDICSQLSTAPNLDGRLAPFDPTGTSRGPPGCDPGAFLFLEAIVNGCVFLVDGSDLYHSLPDAERATASGHGRATSLLLLRTGGGWSAGTSRSVQSRVDGLPAVRTPFRRLRGVGDRRRHRRTASRVRVFERRPDPLAHGLRVGRLRARPCVAQRVCLPSGGVSQLVGRIAERGSSPGPTKAG